jgi:hypothetical protein
MAHRDMRMSLNAEILHAQSPEQQQPTVAATAKSASTANSSNTEWNAGAGGDIKEYWPSHLPRPPSQKKLMETNTSSARVIVFNANTHEGSSLVRVLSDRGLHVNAVVRVYTSKNAKRLTKLRGVTVKVADLNNAEAVQTAAQGCQQAFLVTKYWERFENWIEEGMARTVVQASADVGIQRIVLATFEDTQDLRKSGRKSQIMPTQDGLIYPSFEGMEAINILAKKLGMQMTHMFTSYLDDETSKRSMILIRADDGKIVCQSHAQGV